MQRTKKPNIKNNFKSLICVGAVLGVTIFMADYAYAAQFDVDAAGKAMFEPLLKFIDDWSGPAIFTTGVGAAVAVPGDLKTKALGFGGGALLSGLSIWAVKAGFGIA